jgi:hypothetical protein
MRGLGCERGQVTDSQFANFRDKIEALPAAPSYDKQRLLVDDFLLGKDDKTTVYYAPFDHVNTSARLAIVGLTPGWTQMNVSFVEARSAIDDGKSDSEILNRVKRVAAFSGAMRTNLLSMLDALGVAELLGVGGIADLFEPGGEDLLHSTSALRYPVFIDGENYSGYPPAANKPLLRNYFDLLASELASVDGALIVPLGKAVEGILSSLAAAGQLDTSRTLMGFPHPSGLNAARPRLFAENKEQMTDVVEGWFS